VALKALSVIRLKTLGAAENQEPLRVPADRVGKGPGLTIPVPEEGSGSAHWPLSGHPNPDGRFTSFGAFQAGRRL